MDFLHVFSKYLQQKKKKKPTVPRGVRVNGVGAGKCVRSAFKAIAHVQLSKDMSSRTSCGTIRLILASSVPQSLCVYTSCC